MLRTDWSDEQIALMQKLAGEGWPDSQIAVALNEQCPGARRFNKNMVVGKRHRLGIKIGCCTTPPSELGGAPAARNIGIAMQRPGERRVFRRQRRRQQPALVSTVAACESVAPLVHSIDDLRAGKCRWPIGDPLEAGFGYCGRDTEGRYCELHTLRSQPQSRGQRSASTPNPRNQR